MDFSFPDVDKVLYGKHAKNVMKNDVKETDNSYEVDIDLSLIHIWIWGWSPCMYVTAE